MSLSEELNRWGLQGALSAKGKAQVLSYSDRARAMETAIKRVLDAPTSAPMTNDERQELHDSINGGKA